MYPLKVIQGVLDTSRISSRVDSSLRSCPSPGTQAGPAHREGRPRPSCRGRGGRSQGPQGSGRRPRSPGRSSGAGRGLDQDVVGVLHCSNLQDGEGLIGALLHGAPQDRECLGGDGQGLGGLVGTSEEGAGTE